MDSDALFRMLYLRREHENMVARIAELQGLLFVPDVVTSNGDDVWRGIVFVRHEASPWFGGSFPFTVVFPTKYPFVVPRATFDKPIRSHPMLLDDGETIGFDDEYVGLEIMHVSVMLRLLVRIRRLFAPSEWANGALSHLDIMACRRDVEQCSVTRDVFLNKPYVQLLNTEVSEWFVRTQGRRDKAEELAGKGSTVPRALESFASWFTRTFLPLVKNLQ